VGGDEEAQAEAPRRAVETIARRGRGPSAKSRRPTDDWCRGDKRRLTASRRSRSKPRAKSR